MENKKEREEYTGNDKELLLRLAELKVTNIELMLDWQDYNRNNNNSLPWKKYNAPVVERHTR